MLITSLEKMEQIVCSSNHLEWDGWNVAKYTKSYSGMFSKDGVLKNGEWHKKKIFPLTENGWNIPNSIGQINAQMEE